LTIVVAAALSAGLYLAGVREASGRWPAWRTAAWCAGLVVLVAALIGPVHDRAEALLSAHMLQHLAVTLAAAPLLVLGAPVALALRALRGGSRRRLGAAVTSRPARVLAHPLTGWAAFAAGTAVPHVTGLYDAALRHPALHELEHVLFLATALVWWTSVIGVHPGDARLGAIGRLAWVMAAMPVMAGVGAWLAQSDAVRYAAYTGAGALADQRDAGSLMWALGTFPMALAAFALAGEALWREERRQRRREAVRA